MKRWVFRGSDAVTVRRIVWVKTSDEVNGKTELLLKARTMRVYEPDNNSQIHIISPMEKMGVMTAIW